MDFHAFMYVTIGRRHELERGMAGKDPMTPKIHGRSGHGGGKPMGSYRVGSGASRPNG